MIDVRVFYQKKDRAKYISHLDTNRCMQRAIKRSGLPVWYTKGFNPHMYLTFALPLSLGFESEYEVMDFRLNQEMDLTKVKEIFNRNLPDGFTVFNVKPPVKKPSRISKALFEIRMYGGDLEIAYWQFRSFISQEKIEVAKKTKKGFKIVDIKVEIIDYKLEKEDGFVFLELTLPAGMQKNINPNLFLQEYEKQFSPFERVEIVKKLVFDEDGKPFE